MAWKPLLIKKSFPRLLTMSEFLRISMRE
jgi:hypothetical protein